MKHILRLSFCLFLLLQIFTPFTSRASHAAGGEIAYEWLGDSTYRFYFKFYRDCSGATEPTTQALCYFNSCGSASGSIPMTKLTVLPNGQPNGQEVSTGCPGSSSTCSGGSDPGYREWWYSATMTMPSRCDYWTFYTTISARNPSDNIGGGNLYVEATLDNVNAQGNSSPFFSVKPVPFVCINSSYNYNNGVVDPNSDSIVFEFIQPRTTLSCAPFYTATPVAFTGGYDLTTPMALTGPFVFSTTTGQMTFTPSTISTNTVTVLAKEYRNGKQIGSVMRDIQIQVRNCNSVQPTVNVNQSSIVSAQFTNDRIEACANTPFSFCYNANSSLASAVLVVTDNHTAAAPGSNVTYTGQTTNAVTGCFSWTPSSADTGLKIFTVTVKDSTCQTGGGVLISQTFVLPIYIRAATSSFRSLTVCPQQSVTLTSNGASAATWDVLPGGSPSATLSCTNCNTTVALPDMTTTYFSYSLQANGCSNSDTFRVRVDNTNQVSVNPAGPIVVCRPELYPVTVTTSGMLPLRNLGCGPTPNVPTTPVDTVAIYPYMAPVQSTYGSVASPMIGGAQTARHQYLIRATDMRQSGMYSGTLSGLAFRFLASGSNNNSIRNVRISLKCTTDAALNPAAGFVSGAVPVYNSTAVTQIPGQGGYVYFNFSTRYNWDTTQNLIVEFCYSNPAGSSAVPTYFADAGYTATLYSSAATGNICNGGGGAMLGTTQMPQMAFRYNLAPEVEWSYRWNNGVFLPNANVQSPNVYISESNDIVVSTMNRNGCRLYDTLNVYMPNSWNTPLDTAMCEGEFAYLNIYNAEETGQTYRWYQNNFQPTATLSCTTCPNPIATPVEDVTYVAVVTDMGCLDTFRTVVDYTALPDLDIVTNDTTIKYGQSLQILSHGAAFYQWYPVATLNDPTSPTPIASPLDSVTYVLAGWPIENPRCVSYDTLHVLIDVHDNLFVPSAFSPNGDGRNDRFMVQNLTFQRLQEFRVFNRWGREVFSTRDARNGWDGTFAGEPQDIGAYHYIIKISIPDGSVQTYKGDVTLIR